MGRAVPADDLPGGGSSFESALQAEGLTGRIADVARSIYQQESGSGKNTKTSNAGAVGGMQIIPATFNRMADKGWSIDNPDQNARAGIRYIKTLSERAGGDPALTASGYYGGEGAIDKARRGIAVSDPRNPRAPNTLEYGQQVASRLPRQPQASRAVPANDLPTAQPAPAVKNLDAAAGGANLQFGPFDTGIPISENANNFLAGAGQNIKGLMTGVSQYLPGGATRDDVAEQRRLDTDLNKRSAATAGSLLSNIPLAFIPGGSTLKGAAVIGGVNGLAQPSTSTTETLGQGALGAAGGAIGQYAGNRLGQFLGGRKVVAPTANGNQTINVGPSNAGASANVSMTPQASARTSQMVSVGDDVSAGLTDGQQAALTRGRELGFKTTPGQETGSKVLQQLEAKLESQPASSGTFFNIKNNNQRQLNRTVANELGERSDDLSGDVLDRAYTRMGGVFDSVADDIPRKVDPDRFLNRLAQVESENEGMLAQNIIENPLVSRYYNLVANGQPTGKQLNNLQSQMGKAANSKKMTDPAQAQALREVQHLVLEDIGAGLSPTAQTAFTQARQQYRIYSMLADKPSILNVATGNISGANLANTLQRTDRSGYALGRKDSPMYDAARFTQAFKPLIGDSGTATRSPPNMLELALSVPTSIATRAYTSSPSISAINAMSTTMRDGVAPNLMTPTKANALRRLLGSSGGVAGAAASPLVFGNSAQ